MRCTLPILAHDSLNTPDSLSIKLSHWEHVSGAGYGESRDLNTTVVLHVRERRRACNDRREDSRDAIPAYPFPRSADSDPIMNAYRLRDVY